MTRLVDSSIFFCVSYHLLFYGREKCSQEVVIHVLGRVAVALRKERVEKFASELFTQHDVEETVERRVGHDEKIAHVERGGVYGLKEDAQVLECDQA